jgi:tripartite ATP-independent transporter DctP family solute receptor
MMQRLIKTSLLAALAGTLSWGAIAQEFEIRFAHGSPRGHPNDLQAVMWAEAIEEATGGRMKVTVFGDRQLGDDREIIQLVSSGTVDAGFASSVNFPLILDKVAFDALQLPGLVETYDDLAVMLQSEPAIKMLESLEEVGLVGLCYSDGGQRHFLNREGPVQQIDDFQGLKTRIVPIPLHKEMWERVGTNPIGVAYGEVYTAMQTRVIDAVEFNISSIAADKVYETAKHLTLTGHYFWPTVFFFSKEKFDALPPDIQSAVLETSRSLTPEFVLDTKAREAVSIEELKEAGVMFYQFEDREKLLELMQPVFDRWAEKDPLIGEYIEAARKS